MRLLKQRYVGIVKEYEKHFVEITERKGWWDKDFSLYITEYEAWSLEDMRYIVDTYKDNPGMWKDVRENISGWLDYTSDCFEFGIQYINLRSWIMGCPRMSEETRKQFHDGKSRLEDLIKEQQKKFGAVSHSSVPEHLRNLKK